jgi:stage II sporulation protein D
MKMKAWEAFVILLTGLIIPGIMLRETSKQSDGSSNCTEPTGQIIQETESPDQDEITIHILRQDGTVDLIDLESYVVGVVLAEVPATFELEALKAQAVASRTFGLKRSVRGDKHDVSAVCLKSVCCQGYCTAEEYLAKGGTQEKLDKIILAVQQTRGQVIAYDGMLADTAYFSCSGGRTEDAVAVWGADVPYLKSVESPGEEDAVYFRDTASFSMAEFACKLGIKTELFQNGWLGAVEYSDGGGVQTIQIAGRTYKGSEIRQKLGLRSTAFIITVADNIINITTKGYGHRVGMSQYGANAMAKSGCTYSQILAHYYQGTELATWSKTTN